MRWFFTIPCLALVSAFVCVAEQPQAFRFEGVWKLNGPDPARSRLEFEVNGDNVRATYYHPYPSTLSEIQIEGDRFSAAYLDEYAAKRNVIGELKGAKLELTLVPQNGHSLVTYAGSRIAPEQARGVHQQAGGSFNTSGKGGTTEFSWNGHTVVISGGKEGNCVTASVGADGKGVTVNGCASVPKEKP